MIFPKLKSKVGVYLIVSPTGGRYVGSSKRLDKRFNRYKNLSCSKQSAIYASLKKHGYDTHKFCILIYCEEVDLLFWERCFGDIYLSSANFKQGLNLVLPGYNDVPQHRTQDFNDRVSVIQKKRFEDPEQRRLVSEKGKLAYSNPELRKHQSDTLKEIYKNPQLRKKRSQLQKEYFKSSDAREHARNKTIEYFNNNPDKIEAQQSGLKTYYQQNPTIRRDRQLKRYKENPKLAIEHSEKLKSFYINNPELRKVASERSKLQFANPGTHPMSKRVLDTETGEIIPSLRTLANRLGRPIQTVRNWVKGKVQNPTSYKYI